MKSDTFFQSITGIDPNKFIVRFSFVAFYMFLTGLSLPASAVSLGKQLNTVGNAEITRRLYNDLYGVNKFSPAKSTLITESSNATALKNSFFSSQYKVRDLGSLGGTESFAHAINNKDMIVGLSRTAGDLGTHPFVYSQGKMTDLFPKIETAENVNNLGQVAGGLSNENLFVPAVLDVSKNRTLLLGSLGGATSFGLNGTALAKNDAGQTVGFSYIDTLNRHAFLHTNGIIKDIGSFGGYSVANAINNNDHIVGFSSNSVFGRAHAFLFVNGKMTDLNPSQDPTFENSESYARDINNRGDIVGEFITPNQSAFHSFVYRNGKLISFRLPGSPMTIPFSINNSGKIVGIMDVPYKSTCPGPVGNEIPCTKFKQHAYLYRQGRLSDLNKLIPKNSKWELIWAFDINDKDKIVGYGVRNGKFRAFVLTPRANYLNKLPSLFMGRD